jgi:hypothetical protein
MSLLKTSLDHFLDQLRLKYPESSVFQPPLPLDQIKNLANSLPFKLTTEAYEFVQRINGPSDTVFLGYPLSEFEYEVSSSLEYDFDSNGVYCPSDTYRDKPLFAICRRDAETISIVCDSIKHDKSLVCYRSELGEIAVIFTSLTDMLITLGEGLELGALSLDAYDCLDISGCLKFAEIYRKHNSEILRVVVEWIKSVRIVKETVGDFGMQCHWLHRLLPDITLEQLKDAEAIKIVLEAAEDESDHYVQHCTRLALEELNYSTGIVDELWQKWLRWYERAKKGEALSPGDPGLILMSVSEQLENVRARPPQE